MPEAELIPRIDEDGLVKANADIENLKIQLQPIAYEIEHGEVKTENDYTAMGKLVTQVKDNQKKREWVAAPFKSIITTIKQTIDGMSNVNDCKLLIALGKQKMSDWRMPERDATAAEEQELNKQRARVGLPPIKVKANIPTVPGLAARTNYHAECVDFDKLLAAYRKATPAGRKFLEQFLMPNDQNIGKHARETKDDDKVMKDIPGSKAWHTS